MSHTRFSAKSFGSNRTGIAVVVDHPKGGIIRIGDADVGMLDLETLNRIRFAESNGLAVDVHIDLCEPDQVYGRIITREPVAVPGIARHWRPIAIVIAGAVVLWAIAMIAVKLGF